VLILCIAAIIGILSKLASNSQVGNNIKGKIDCDKTDTLFWQIIG